jgi:hypothetical protein
MAPHERRPTFLEVMTRLSAMLGDSSVRSTRPQLRFASCTYSISLFILAGVLDQQDLVRFFRLERERLFLRWKRHAIVRL